MEAEARAVFKDWAKQEFRCVCQCPWQQFRGNYKAGIGMWPDSDRNQPKEGPGICHYLWGLKSRISMSSCSHNWFDLVLQPRRYAPVDTVAYGQVGHRKA